MEKITYTQLDIVMSGEKIHNIIIERGYKVKELQALLNLSYPQPIYRWMKGKILPSVDHLYMMHRIFGVHMEDMLVARDVGKDC